jgi:septum formation protein
MLISKNLAELKSTKVSVNQPDQLVLGADSVISLNDELINKPNTREEGLKILQKLNGSKHFLITSVCVSKNGVMVWNFTDQSELIMKKLTNKQLVEYLQKIKTETLLNYGVYQIEAGGLELFDSVEGDKNSIMGLPIKQIIDYIKIAI